MIIPASSFGSDLLQDIFKYKIAGQGSQTSSARNCMDSRGFPAPLYIAEGAKLNHRLHNYFT